jgi:hypothetical protein
MKPEPVRFSPRVVLLPGCEVDEQPANTISATPSVNVLKRGFMQFFLSCIRDCAGVERPGSRVVHRIGFSCEGLPLHKVGPALLRWHDLMGNWREMDNPPGQGASS